MELSQTLKNMRLRAVESGNKLFHRDFTVGTIQIEVCDDWNGANMVSIPLTNPTNAITVVPPGGKN